MPRSSLLRSPVWIALLAGVSCAAPVVEGPKTPAAKSAAAAKDVPGPSFGLPRAVPKLRLMPDLAGSRGVVLSSDEGELSLFGRMRLSVSPAGVVERADDLMPVGRIVASALPPRLGGGYVFLAVSGRGTELWRSSTWLGQLTPLVSFGTVADAEEPLTVGFDRLMVRMRSGNELVALDPRDGSALAKGPLPIAPAYGDMAFLDGWRAVVDTDVAGTFATFDAGATWQRLDISGRVRSIEPSSKDPDDGEDGVITTDAGVHRLSPSGQLSFVPGSGPQPSFATPPTPPSPRARGKKSTPGPLGRRPLRVAIERGYPDSEGTAVVLFEGTLARVSLASGALHEVALAAIPDQHAECTGIGLGDAVSQVGFVCGATAGPTVVYALTQPFGVREVMRFATPRAVTESGQGAIVVRGPCADGPVDPASRPFCVRFADGALREVRVRGEVGAERVVALQDGRVVILVPPRPGAQGQLSILTGQSSKHVVLKAPEAGLPRELETGMWLEGVHQSGPDAIGAWVEAGGPTLGVTIKLSGEVTVGDAVDEPGGVLVAGRFGLAVGDRGKLLETVDTGQTWKELDLPIADESASSRVRRCGAAGCALASWLKVGWGPPAREDDLREAPAPQPWKLSQVKLSSTPFALACERTEGGKQKPARTSPAEKFQGVSPTGWGPFKGVDGPALRKDELGLDHGVPYDATPLRAYAWGKKDSDWSRTGRFLVRYGDRFGSEEVRSSAVTTSPFAHEAAAQELLNAGVTWTAQRDGGGALLSACRGRGCSLFAVEHGAPVLMLRAPEGTVLPKPFQNGAVRVGQAWYFLGDPGPDQVALYRSELSTVRRLNTFKRLTAGRYMPGSLPRLIRRKKTDDLGLMFVIREGAWDRRGQRVVIPIDAGSGELGDAVSLGAPDLTGMAISPGCGDRDGWLIETLVDPTPNATLDGEKVSFDSVELRLLIDEQSACVDAGLGTFASPGGTKKKGATTAGKPAPKSAPDAAGAFSLVGTERSSGARSTLSCSLGKKTLL